MADEIIQIASITEETRKRYLNYAMSVITARALPDVRDGLKPVQRRILYTMFHELHLHPDGRTRKCAKICGDVVGNYHPHSDVAAYDALVRLAQSWVMREPLVTGQGNFGSVDGDPPAHQRYTEAKLAALAEPLMTELRQRTVDMRPNYDNTREEPMVLPAQFPNLLVNGCSGIAVGMATNVPPHNLADVVKAAIHLIGDPDATTAQLLDRVKGPDFPLGGRVITDRTALRTIYEEGTGTIKIQGEWKTEETGRKEYIIITSIPYGVDKGKLENDIGAIIETRKLPQLLGLTNESNEKDGLRIALEVKPGTEPNLVMAYLYKNTQLQETFSYNLTCLVPHGKALQPQRLGLKEILRHFLDFRFATVKRRFEFDLEQLRKRLHILEGFRIIFDALDKAIRLIRESNGKADAAEKLMKAFKLDEIQTEAILDAQLYKIAQLEIKKIIDELKEKKAEAAKIEAILASNKKLWGVVETELNGLATTFGTRRRTRMAGEDDTPEFNEEAYIVRENTNVVLTKDGWIKRVGRLASVEGTRVREGDEVSAVIPGNTLDYVIFFTDDGTACTMRMFDVPASSGYGEPIGKYFKLADQVKIIGCTTTDPRFTPPDAAAENGVPAPPYLLVVTAQGQTLRTPLAPFRTESNKLGRRYVKLNEGDRVLMARMLRDEQTIYLASANGHVIHFAIEEINILSGVGKGVMGIKLAEGDTCVGGALMSGRSDRMFVENTRGGTMEIMRNKYEPTTRGGKGFRAILRGGFVRVLPPPIELVNWDEVEERKAEGKNGSRDSLFD